MGLPLAGAPEGTAGLSFSGVAGFVVGEAGVVFAGQGGGCGLAPVTSSADEGRSQRFLFCLQASALAFFSSQPGLGGGGACFPHGVPAGTD
jgi:hypothetical protein